MPVEKFSAWSLRVSIITRYARRVLIVNGLADGVDFFHLDAMSSAVSLGVDFDVLLTVLASDICRLFARSLRGREQAPARPSPGVKTQIMRALSQAP